MADINAQVDRLLHDAEHADSGAMMARIMRDERAAREFDTKKAALLAEAEQIDPKHTAPAWEEVDV